MSVFDDHSLKSFAEYTYALLRTEESLPIEMASNLQLTVLVVLMAACACFAAVPEPSTAPETAKDDHRPVDREEIKKYLAMMDKLNVEQILNNTRLMSNNIKCFLNEGPCSAQLKDMKKVLPMLVKDSCSSCTKEQKKMVKKTMERIKEQRPEAYEKLSKFFDPEGIYEKKLMENLKDLDQS